MSAEWRSEWTSLFSSYIRKLRLRSGDLPKFPQLLSGREGCAPVCSAQTLVLLYNGDLSARIAWWDAGSGCICTFTVTHRDVPLSGVVLLCMAPSSNPDLPTPQAQHWHVLEALS